MEDSGISSIGECSNSSNDYQNVIGNIVTEKMVNEELELEKQAIKEEKVLKDDMLKEEKKQLEEQCYKRLNLLLSRSSIYAQFMAEKLKRDDLKEAKRQARSEKQKDKSKQQTIEKKSVKRKNESNNHSPQKRTHSELTVIDAFRKDVNGEEDKQDNDTDEILEKLSQDTSGSDNASRQQPALLTGGVMHPYQIEGYEWLKVLFENGVNGILADEMGLGKTIQSIAFVAYLVEMGVTGPFFVCGPLSTVPNWYLEFQRFTPNIPVMIYHGDKAERAVLRGKILKKVQNKNVSSYPVVITSYQIALNDFKFLAKYEWKLLVVDEAHRIKNFQCKLVAALKCFNATHRLLLTGTPLQNNLSELWSLLNFILPEIFDDLKVFESWFDVTRLIKSTEDIVVKEQEKQIVTIIHQILTPFLLRRTKAEVELNLPSKKEVIVHAPLTKLQQEYYTAALNKTLEDLAGVERGKHFKIEEVDVNSGRPSRNKNVDFAAIYKMYNDKKFENSTPVITNTFVSEEVSKPDNSMFADVNVKVRNVMMLLRKICGHPYLISYPLDNSGGFKVDEDLIRNSGKLLVLDMLLPELKKGGHKILIFSQFVSMLEILEDYCRYRKYNFNLLHGSMNLEERDEHMQEFRNSPDSFIFLISTRAGGLGINLAHADTVIIYDSDWNPQSDLQAQDRCHRIGQTRPVIVYRLVVPNTMDEHIVDRAAAKRKLEKVIIKTGRFASQHKTSYDKMSIEELIKLLESCDYSGFVKTNDNNVLSPDELKRILDRSDMV